MHAQLTVSSHMLLAWLEQILRPSKWASGWGLPLAKMARPPATHQAPFDSQAYGLVPCDTVVSLSQNLTKQHAGALSTEHAYRLSIVLTASNTGTVLCTAVPSQTLLDVPLQLCMQPQSLCFAER